MRIALVGLFLLTICVPIGAAAEYQHRTHEEVLTKLNEVADLDPSSSAAALSMLYAYQDQVRALYAEDRLDERARYRAHRAQRKQLKEDLSQVLSKREIRKWVLYTLPRIPRTSHQPQRFRGAPDDRHPSQTLSAVPHSGLIGRRWGDIH